MRLIDADKLKAEIRREYILDDRKRILDKIDRQPTYVPEWEKHEDMRNMIATVRLAIMKGILDISNERIAFWINEGLIGQENKK